MISLFYSYFKNTLLLNLFLRLIIQIAFDAYQIFEN